MKKIFAFLLIFVMTFTVTGCSFIGPSLEPRDVLFKVEDYPLQITADNDFHKSDSNNFDLQITNNKSFISIMAYKYIDLSEDTTPLDIYDIQNENLFNLRQEVAVIEKDSTSSFENYTITKAMYSATKEGTKNYYATYLIDFPKDEIFAWVLITAVPSYMESNLERLDNIVCSLTTVKQK